MKLLGDLERLFVIFDDVNLYCFNKDGPIPASIFVYFRSFQPQIILHKKLWASVGFKVRSSE